MAAPSSFDEAFEHARRAALEGVQRERQKQLEVVPFGAQLWLAVAPSWTLALAEACKWPTGAETPASTLDRLAALGLVEHIDASARALTRFWITDAARADYQQRAGRRLVTEAAIVARRILGAGPKEGEELGPAIPLVTWRWALVARRIREVATMERYFTDRFREALERRGPDDARVWLQAIRPIDPLVGGQLTTVTQRAIRALALHDREENDRASIAHYLVRDEQLSVYRDLVNGPDTVYALHYLGGGGVGKTMLMRYLTSQRPLTMSDGTPLPERTAARIDFDYVNPDYPGKRPGLLLTQLAEELRVKDLGGRAAPVLEKQFFQKIKFINQQIDLTLAGQRGGASLVRPDASIESILREPLDIFADACLRLERPPLLILDTCEELARLGPDNQVPESVERTFELLDCLHRRLPKLRVIFSGRRPLAREYANTGPVADAALPTRQNVELHEILAFTAQEGARFLRKEGVSRELARPILERSRAAGYRPLLPAAQHQRFSPFSVSLYAGWVRHRPTLKPEEILNDPVDQFVRIRILERVRNQDVRDALPAVALLGRFDLGMLQAALDTTPATAAMVLQELGREEWIDRQASGFLQIEPDLRERLRVHFSKDQHGSRLERPRWRLIDYLEPLTLQPGSPTLDTGRLDVAHVDVLARLLEADPERAATWWQQLEDRSAHARAWVWLERTTNQLLSRGGALAARGEKAAPHPLRTVALLTLWAVRAQLGKENGLPLWGESDFAPPELRVRSWAISVASGSIAAIARLQRVLTMLGVAPPLSVMPALLAAGEQLLNWFDGGTFDTSQPAQALREITLDLTVNAFGVETGHWPIDLKPFVLAMRARAARQAGRDGDAKTWWLDLRNRLFSDNPIATGGYLDWVAPADPRARLRLEYLRAVYPVLMSARQTVDSWVEPLRNDSIDADRVRSAMLRLMASLETPKPETFEQGSEQARALPTCEAHRAFPPSVVVRAENRAAWGDVDGALQIIDAFVSESLSAQGGAELAQSARISQWRISRRMRLPVTDDSIDKGALDDEDQLMAAAREGLMRPFAPAVATPLTFHAMFRSSRARGVLLADAVGAPPVGWHASIEVPSRPSEALLNASLWLDAVELNMLGPIPAHMAGRFPTRDAMRTAALETVRRTLPMIASTANELRLRLRLEALALERDDLAIRAVGDRLGLRAAAHVALDEGELLALRLPRQARRMLDRATAWFVAVDDVVGMLLCAGVTAMAALSSHRDDEARKAMEQAERAYTRVASLLATTTLSPYPVAPLTAWSELAAIAATPSRDRLAAVGPEGWRYWQFRFIACWTALSEHPQERLGVLRDLLGVDATAPELEALFEAMASASTDDAASPRAKASESVAVATAPPPAIRVEIRCDASRGWWPIVPQRGRFCLHLDSVLVAEVPFAPALDRSQEVGWGLEQRVQSWRSAFDWTRVLPEVDPAQPIDFVLERPHAWISWETLLPLCERRPSDPPLRGLPVSDVVTAPVLRRRIPRTTTRTLPRPAEHLGLDLVAPDYLQHWLRDVWGSLVAQRHVVVNTPTFGDMAQGSRSFTDRCHAAVLVCTPIETPSGVTLAVQDERFNAGNGSMLQASQLARWAPDVSLVVLQPAPVDHAEWGRGERDTMVCLRLFAAELFTRGVSSVLVLPPSDRAAMDASWRVLADVLPRATANLGPLLGAAIPRLRQAIAEGTQWPAPDQRAEAALSMAWYADDRVPWYDWSPS
jgi:hypothetical protein